MIIDIYKFLSRMFNNIFNNTDMYDIIRLLDEECFKSIIYKTITNNLNNLHNNTILLEEYNEIKEELTLLSFSNYLINNQVIKKNYDLLSCDIYYIFGYLSLNKYDIEKIKSYDDTQIIIFIKHIYTNIIYDYLSKLSHKIIKFYDTEFSNLNINVNILSEIKENIAESKKIYEEIALIK